MSQHENIKRWMSGRGVPFWSICQTIGVYERNLPSPPFCRLDRSMMLNISRVQTVEISPTRGAKVSLRGMKAPLLLGRAALRRLRQAMSRSGLDGGSLAGKQV